MILVLLRKIWQIQQRISHWSFYSPWFTKRILCKIKELFRNAINFQHIFASVPYDKKEKSHLKSVSHIIKMMNRLSVSNCMLLHYTLALRLSQSNGYFWFVDFIMPIWMNQSDILSSNIDVHLIWCFKFEFV